ncbi:hypothetical protein HHI36_016101 [Cryptolaemus montrouzieri]|uniref:Uncharacterized protein n=1 Tax=Cryptolaemus montrouzieri TaxID=559131 RepID=A0ABD2NJI7_9CUCU
METSDKMKNLRHLRWSMQSNLIVNKIRTLLPKMKLLRQMSEKEMRRIYCGFGKRIQVVQIWILKTIELVITETTHATSLAVDFDTEIPDACSSAETSHVS